MTSLLGGTLLRSPFRVAAIKSLEMSGFYKTDIENCDEKIDGICLWKDISEAWIVKIRSANSWQEYKAIFKVPEVEMKNYGFIDTYVYEPIIKAIMITFRLFLFVFSFLFLFIAIMLHIVYGISGILSLRRRVQELEEKIEQMVGRGNQLAQL